MTPEKIYNAKNAVGNPLKFDAAIELRGEKPAAALAFQPNYPVWEGAMNACTFEDLESFIVLISDAYGVTDGCLKLTHQEKEHVILWDCDKGYVSGPLTGAEAVKLVAAALIAPEDSAEGGWY